MILLLMSSLFSSSSAQPQPCFLKCKDNYMHGMQTSLIDSSAEWSVEMVTPLQALLTGDNKRGRLNRKLEKVCRLNYTYNRCLSFCPDNPAKRILMKGQEAWNIICDDFKNNTEFAAIVVPCWADNGQLVIDRCSQQAKLLQAEIISIMEGGVENINEGIGNMCSSVHSYDKCFVWESYEVCGINAGKFLIKLTHQTSHALIDLLDTVLGVQQLPKQCKDWLNQKGLFFGNKNVWSDMAGLQKARSSQRRLRNSSSWMILTLCMSFTTGLYLYQ